MSLSESFPYIESGIGNEGPDHVRLKNIAILWLTRRGVSVSDIEIEKMHSELDWSRKSRVATDIYVESGGIELYVECETNYASRYSLSMGGTVPLKHGKDVFLVTDDGIFRLFNEEIKTGRGNETTTRIQRSRIANLPFVDLTSFK